MAKLAPILLVLASCVSSPEKSTTVVSVDRSAQPIIAQIGYEAPPGSRLLVADEHDGIVGVLEVEASGRGRSRARVVSHYSCERTPIVEFPPSHWWLKPGCRVFNPLAGVRKVWLAGEPRTALRVLLERRLRSRYGASLVDRPQDDVRAVVIGEPRVGLPDIETEAEADLAAWRMRKMRAKFRADVRAAADALGATVLDEHVFWDLIDS